MKAPAWPTIIIKEAMEIAVSFIVDAEKLLPAPSRIRYFGRGGAVYSLDPENPSPLANIPPAVFRPPMKKVLRTHCCRSGSRGIVTSSSAGRVLIPVEYTGCCWVDNVVRLRVVRRRSCSWESPCVNCCSQFTSSGTGRQWLTGTIQKTIKLSATKPDVPSAYEPQRRTTTAVCALNGAPSSHN